MCQFYDVALEIQDVVIRREGIAAVGGIVQSEGTAGFIVDEIQNLGGAAACYCFPRDLPAQGQVFMRDSLCGNQRLSGMAGSAGNAANRQLPA